MELGRGRGRRHHKKTVEKTTHQNDGPPRSYQKEGSRKGKEKEK
jgi:hypothetical protein